MVHTTTSSTSPVEADEGGAEELAAAEKYLNGNPATSGSAGEAAPWLWKAVAKGNLTAAMTLSDMYLRGEGVIKNCDQARLLLDAAARKGKPAAAQRLRNLQAFGCQ
jgi:TPR repeat protein